MTTDARACAASATPATVSSSGGAGRLEFEHADGFPAVGHRREHAGLVRPNVDPDGLGGQRATLRASLQRHPLGGFATLRARSVDAAGVAEPDEGSSTEVC